MVMVSNLVLGVLKWNSHSVMFDVSVGVTVCSRACLCQTES